MNNNWEIAQIFLFGVIIGIFIETLYVVFDIIKDPDKAEKTIKSAANSARKLKEMWGQK